VKHTRRLASLLLLLATAMATAGTAGPTGSASAGTAMGRAGAYPSSIGLRPPGCNTPNTPKCVLN
jgi:hypothetical protein